MKVVKPVRYTLRAVLAVAGGAGLLLGAGAKLSAQSSGEFLPQFTIVEIMDSIVMPAAQVVWDGVTYEDAGIAGPKTDEGWQKLRWSAIDLAESANVLMVPGRAANLPGAVAGEGELAPEKITELIETQRAAWVAYAHTLHEAAAEAVRAIDAKNPEALADAGGTIDATCQGCHQQFWYPQQQ